MSIEQARNSGQKARWMEPEVVTLDISDTSNVVSRGRDGGTHIDCTRS